MKEITEDFLKNEKKVYLSNNVNTVARHALNKSKLIDIVRVSDEIDKLTNDFSIKADTATGVTNQEASGRCWLFSTANILREAICKKYNIENFELSENYISFYDQLEKANYFLESMTKEMCSRDYNDRTLRWFLKSPVYDGGYIDFFVNIVEKYGVVPKSSFSETYQSLHMDATNRILNTYLRKVYIELKNNVNKSDEEFEAIKTNAMKNVYKILLDIYGVPPTTIDFEYTDKDKKYHIEKNITPLDFYHKNVGVDLKKYHSVVNFPIENRPYNVPYVFKEVRNVAGAAPEKYLNIEINHFKDLAIEQLKAGEIIFFACDVLRYSNNDDGIMNEKAYDYNSLFDIDLTISKGDELITRNAEVNHAMALTGVNLDENGKPTKWRIENSWGDKKGKKGFYIATDEWFDKYVYELFINDKYFTEEDKNNLAKEPIELECWDPVV